MNSLGKYHNDINTGYFILSWLTLQYVEQAIVVALFQTRVASITAPCTITLPTGKRKFNAQNKLTWYIAYVVQTSSVPNDTGPVTTLSTV